MGDFGTILVTGASGNVGRAVVQALRARGVPVRAAHRGMASSASDAVEHVTFDFRKPETFTAAARGCRHVFLVRPPPVANVKDTLIRFVDHARALGVEHVVFLSVIGAGDNRFIPHHAVEVHLARTASHTFLRAGFFAQNLGDAYLRDIREDDRIYVPAGVGKVAFVDVRDIAEVAAMALTIPAAHRGRTYTLTGPEAVTFQHAATLLAATVGRRIRYEPASVLGYVRHLRRQGLPFPQALVQAALHVGIRFGQAASVDPTLARLLGHPSRALGEYIRDHALLWKPARPE